MVSLATSAGATTRSASDRPDVCGSLLFDVTRPGAQWRHVVEGDGSFLRSLSPAAPTACDFTATDGVWQTDYRFLNGDSLRATRDARGNHPIIVLVGRVRIDPARSSELLVLAERAVSGNPGCGIDWETPTGSIEETVEYRSVQDGGGKGASCACSAGVDREADGTLTFFSIHATC